MDRRYLNRLPRIENFEEEICRNICENYSLGEFESYSVVETGYEDFNFILLTNIGRYFVKIFSKERKEADCRRIISLITLLIKKRVHHPHIYKNKLGDYIKEIPVNSTKLLLIVMEFIDGMNFFELNKSPSKEEIKQLAEDIAQINSITLGEELPFLYDSWAIPNFAIEYDKKKKCLHPEEVKILKPILKEFLCTDMESLPKALVHGDIIKTNVLKDTRGKIWIIDFSVANVYPRVLEIAVTATHLLLDIFSKEKTADNLRILLGEYEKYLELTKQEKNALPKLIKFSYGIEYLNTIFEERIKGNRSKENSSLKEEAKIGLSWGNLH